MVGRAGDGVDEEKIEIYPAQSYYVNYRTGIMIIPATVRYIQISFDRPFARCFRPSHTRGMTFLIKLYDDDKKVLKIYFQPHKECEKVRPRPETPNGSDFNALSYFYLAYHRE